MSKQARPRSLLTLPVEIQELILAHAIPANQTLQIKSCKPRDDDDNGKLVIGSSSRPRPPAVLERPKVPESCSTAFVTPMLLISKQLHSIASSLIYSRNTFSFPDTFTAKSFASQISIFAVQAIEHIRINACGAIYEHIRVDAYRAIYEREIRGPEGWTGYRFEHGPDPAIALIPSLFPNLLELRLAGVGPGVVRDVQVDNRRQDIVMWDMDAIELVARIIDGDGDGDSMVQPDSQSSTASIEKHSLTGGRVFCKRVDPDEVTPDAFMRVQRSETRIVSPSTKHDVDFQHEDEEEVDVPSTLNIARNYHARAMVWRQRQEEREMRARRRQEIIAAIGECRFGERTNVNASEQTTKRRGWWTSVPVRWPQSFSVGRHQQQ